MTRDEELAELAARVAHALRTPLGVVAGALDQLATGTEADRARLGELAGRSLAQIARIADRLALLDRLERGIHAGTQSASMRAIVANAVEQVTRSRRRRGVEVAVADTGADGKVVGDATLLSAAIAELVDNALRFAKTRATVELDAATQTIVIANDGAPIPTAALERLQRSRPLSSDRAGLGIGMWIAARIVGVHGGSIEPIDQPEGARFRVCLVGPL